MRNFAVAAILVAALFQGCAGKATKVSDIEPWVDTFVAAIRPNVDRFLIPYLEKKYAEEPAKLTKMMEIIRVARTSVAAFQALLDELSADERAALEAKPDG